MDLNTSINLVRHCHSAVGGLSRKLNIQVKESLNVALRPSSDCL